MKAICSQSEKAGNQLPAFCTSRTPRGSHFHLLSVLGECEFSSQNHRMVRGGRDLCGSSSSTPLPKQGHLQQAAQDRIQVGLEYLQRRLHNLSGQPVPVLRHPQREEVLPRVQLELPVPQFVLSFFLLENDFHILLDKVFI